MESTCACVLGFRLEHSCPWPRECLSSERLSLALASNFFYVLGLGLEHCVLDSTSGELLLCYLKSQKCVIYIVCFHFIGELWFRFDLWYENLVPQLWNCITLSTESKSLLRKLCCASDDIKSKMHLLYLVCAINGLNSSCILLRSAFVKFYLCLQHLENIFLSTVCLLKKKNVIDDVDNKIQAGLNMIIHISLMHLVYYYVKIFRRGPALPGLSLLLLPSITHKQ